MSSYLSVSGTVMQIQPVLPVQNDYGCTLNMTIRSTSQGEVNFTLTGETYVVDNTPLNPGDRVTVFYDGNAPVPLIYPPQYRAVAAAVSSYYNYYLGEFYSNFISTDGTLQINSSSQLNMILPNGQAYYGALAGHTVLVEYTASTRSIPALINPDRIIVFCYT